MTAPRTGWDTIADLRDAPDKLRALANLWDSEDIIYSRNQGGPTDRDLRRWADATQEFLDGVETAHWKVYAYLGACAAVGALAGAVAVMVAVR